jgi:hypothetical protein
VNGYVSSNVRLAEAQVEFRYSFALIQSRVAEGKTLILLDYLALFSQNQRCPRVNSIFCGGFVSAFEFDGCRTPSQSLRTSLDDASRWLCFFKILYFMAASAW